LLLSQIGFRAYNWGGLRTPPSNLDQASISHTSSGPVYDAAYLNELKASTPSSRPRIPEGGTHHNGSPITSVMEDSAIENLDSIGNRLRIPLFRIYYVLICPSFTDTGVAAIPSQSAVFAAKEKRERMRAAGPSSSHTDDYISLSLTTRNDEYQGPHPESRLMREDDDLGQGDDGELIQPIIFATKFTLFTRFCRIYECPNTNCSR
jgi:GC-rich sequence DNA-binding factor